MPLVTENVVVPMISGLAEGVSKRVRPVGKLSICRNARFDKTGEIRKRFGMSQMTGVPFSTARAMFSTGRELCVVTDRRIFAFNETSLEWFDRGPVSPFTGRLAGVFEDERTYDNGDTASGTTGFQLYVADGRRLIDHLTVEASVERQVLALMRTPSDAVVFGPAIVQSESVVVANKPHASRAVGATGRLYCYYALGANAAAAQRIAFRDIDTTAVPPFSLAAETIEAADVYVPSFGARTYDVIGLADGRFVVARIDFPDRDIILRRYSETHTLQSTRIISANDPYSLVAIAEAGANLYVFAWGSSGGAGGVDQLLLMQIDTATLADNWGAWTVVQTITAPEEVQSLAVAEGNSRAACCWGLHDPTPFTYMTRFRSTNLAGGALDTTITIQNSSPRSRPFNRGTRWYCGLESRCQDSSFEADTIVDFALGATATSYEVVGLFNPGVGHSVRSTSARIGSLNNVIRTLDEYRFALPVEGFENLANESDGPRFALEKVVLDFAKAPLVDVAHNGSAVIGGGILSYYDGEASFELGFACPPVITDSRWLMDGVAPGLFNGFTAYRYHAVFESFDALGVYHRSVPSAAKLATSFDVGDNYVELNARMLGLDNRAQQGKVVNVVFYRAGPDGVFGRVNRSIRVVPNLHTQHESEIFRDIGDAQDASGNSTGVPIYITGGVLEASPPEGARIVKTMGERVYTGDHYHGDRMQFSKRITSGTPTEFVIAPEFSEGFGFGVESGETVTGLAELGSVRLVFTATRIFALAGRGPDDAGQNDDHSGLQPISSDAGCTDPRSVVEWPGGVMFRSARGIYNVSKSFEVVFIGEDVLDLTTSFPTVTSAVVVPAQNQIRFTCNDLAGTEGRIIVFDYRVGAWSEWKIVIFAGAPAFAAATLHKGIYYAVTASGSVWKDTTGFYDDSIRFVPLVVETAWIQRAGMSGWQRVYGVTALCEKRGPHGLQVQIFSDFVETADVSRSFTEAEINALPEITSREQVRVGVRRQRCQAVKVRIEDTAPAGFPGGEGYVISGLTLQLAVERGTVRVAATQRS